MLAKLVAKKVRRNKRYCIAVKSIDNQLIVDSNNHLNQLFNVLVGF